MLKLCKNFYGLVQKVLQSVAEFVPTRVNGSKQGGKWRDRRREKHCQFFYRERRQQRKHEASS